DDGLGIAEMDRSVMAQRHHTSKIRTLEDISAVHTFGFRGKALNSMCAVSETTLITRTRDEPVAALLALSTTGQIIKSHPTSGEPGTSVVVKGLFFNVPVRRR
ncbi:histidine kinase-like ATPase, partial [Thamnocephalis sphaerospora]